MTRPPSFAPGTLPERRAMIASKTLRRFLLASLMLAVASPLACGQDKGGRAVVPEARTDASWWINMHQKFVDRAKKKDIDLLFLGDSITQGWGENPTWQRYYAPRNAANFGIGGDRTQHVIWRLDNGEIDGIAPKVAVLMIGTNNIGSNTPEEIAAGVEKIVKMLREKLPNTKVLLLGVFPRGGNVTRENAKTLTAASQAPQPGQINALIAKLDDGKAVKYLDIGKSFLDANGEIPRDLMNDFLHLTDAGYRAWAEAIEPTLWAMMND